MSKSSFGKRTLAIVLLMALLAPVLLFGVAATLSRINNAPYTWLPGSFKARAEFDSFADTFQTFQSITVSWRGCTIDDDRVLEFAETLKSHEKFTRDIQDVITVKGMVDLLAAEQPQSYEEIEERLHGRLSGTFIGLDEKTTCAVVVLTFEGNHHAPRVINSIKQVAKDVGVSEDDLHLAGTPVDGLAINEANNNSMLYFALPSMLLSVLICRICLRSTMLTILIGAVAAFGAAVSLALVSAIGAQMNAILMTMAPLIFVLTVSGGVHLVNYFYDEVRVTGPSGAARRAISMGWYPCTLAATTTGIGLASLTVSNVSPVWFFGLLSTIGILLTVILLLLVLPGAMQRMESSAAMLRRGSEPNHAIPTDNRGMSHWFTSMYARWWAFLSIAFLALAIYSAVGLPKLTTSVAVTDLLHRESKLVHDYEWMEDNLGPLIPIELMVRFNSNCALDTLERVELLRDIESHVKRDIGIHFETSPGARGVIKYVTPGGQAYGEDGPRAGDRVVQGTSDGKSVQIAVQRPGEESHREYTFQNTNIGTFSAFTFVPGISRSHAISQQTRRVVTRKQLEKQLPFFESAALMKRGADGEVWRITTRAPALGNVDYGEYINNLKSRVDYFLYQVEGHHADVNVTYTGLTPVIYQVQEALLDDLMHSFLAAFVLVMIVMILVLRNIPGGMLIMLPNVFPAVVLFGMMAWFGKSVDIGTMMTASVAFGIAVDDTLHFLTWFRRELDAGNEPQQAVQKTLQHCAKAMIQTTAICGIGMLILAFCGFVPMQRFGMMMSTLLVLALVGDLIFLPAILLSPLGRIFIRQSVEANASEESSANGSVLKAEQVA